MAGEEPKGEPGATTSVTVEKTVLGVVVYGADFRQVTLKGPPGIVLYRFEGRTPADVFEPGRKIMDECIVRNGSITLIGDGGEWSWYEGPLREAWTNWFRANKAGVRAVHLLVRSALLKMGVQIVNMFVGGVITAYNDSDLFYREMDRLFPTVDLSEIRAARKAS